MASLEPHLAHSDFGDQYLEREPRVWYDLDHDNILPLLGYTTDVSLYPALVSPFCKQGHVMEYLEKHPDADRAQMVTAVFLSRKQILTGIIGSPSCRRFKILAFQENSSHGFEIRLSSNYPW